VFTRRRARADRRGGGGSREEARGEAGRPEGLGEDGPRAARKKQPAERR
jgi:hypothetical protein